MEGPSGFRRATVAGVLALCAVLTVISIATLIWSSFRGYDISDEGFFVYAADPANKSNTANGLWGMYIGLLYRGVGYSIPAFRIVGIALLAIVAVWAASRANLLLRALAGRAVPRTAQLGVVLATVAAVLMSYDRYVLAPSYNWLALCGILVAIGGLFGILAGRTMGAGGMGYAAAISTGCFIAFWGRPAAGAGLWLLTVFVVVLRVEGTRATRARLALAELVTLVMLAVLHMAFLLGPSDTWDALQRARSFNFAGRFSKSVRAMLSDAAHGTFGAPHRMFEVATALPLLGCLPLIALIVAEPRRARMMAVLSACAVGIVGVILSITKQFGGGPEPYKTVGPATLAVLCTAGLTWISAACVRKRTSLHNDGLARPAQLRIGLVVVLLLTAAGLFAFTSNNPFLDQAGVAAVLGFVAAVFVLVGAAGPRHMIDAVLGVAAASSAAALALAVTGPDAPFRDAPLARAHLSVVVNQHGSHVLLARDEAAFFNALIPPARAAGFAPGTPLIDLTPFSPGAADALGASAPDTLLFGYYAYSARWALERQDRATWRKAWILVRVSGAGLIDPQQVVPTVGRSFPADYTLVTTATWPFSHEVDQLWRPRS